MLVSCVGRNGFYPDAEGTNTKHLDFLGFLLMPLAWGRDESSHVEAFMPKQCVD